MHCRLQESLRAGLRNTAWAPSAPRQSLMPVTLKCLSHPPRPGWRLSCVCLRPRGDELQSFWGLNTGVMGVFLRAGAGGSSGTVPWPPGQVREVALGSVVPGNGLSGFIPKPCPSQSDHSPESWRVIHTAWTICQIPRHSRRTCDRPLCPTQEEGCLMDAGCPL